jgi:hypothetical protein
LRHTIVQLARDPLALVVQQSIALSRVELSAQPLQAGDHIALLFEEAGIADGNGDLVGED